MANKNNNIKALIIGGLNSGKTTFAHYLSDNCSNFTFPLYLPGAGNPVSKTIIYNNKSYILNIFDSSGHERYDHIYSILYWDAKIIFIFFDYYSKNSFQRAKHLFTKVKEQNKEFYPIIILIGNKYREKNFASFYDENLNEEEVLEFAQENNLLFAHLSVFVKHSNGINELFDKVLKEYIKKSNINKDI